MRPIQHGRRRGTTRTEEGLPKLNKERELGYVEDTLKEQKTPDVASTMRTTTIDRQELRRIYDAIADGNPEAEEIRRIAAERQKMYETSKEMSSGWPNVSVGGREKKIARMKQMEADREAERVAVDLKEAEYQAQKRKERMEEARRMITWQTDRYKNFHSALLTCETMRENDALLELRRKMAAEKKTRDKGEAERLQKALVEVLEGEARVQAEKQKIRKDNQKFQLYQVKCHEEQQQNEDKANREEREKIQERYKEYLEDMKLTKEAQEIQKLKNRNNLHLQTAQQQATCREMLHMNQEEDKERKVTSLAKRQLMCKRLAKEKAMKKEKDDIHDALYQRLQKYFAEKDDDYEERIIKSREEEDAKKREEEEEKEAKRKQGNDAVMEHLEMTLKQHEEQKAREKEEGRRDATVLAEAALIFAQGELEKRNARKEGESEADVYNHRMRVRYGERQQAKRNEELAIDMFNEMNHRKTEAEFQDYATTTIGEAAARGAPTLAMEQDLRRTLALERPCETDFLGKGPLKPTYMTQDEMEKYIDRLNIKENQLCLEKMRGRTPTKDKKCL